MKRLFTGFRPFLNYQSNPSWEIAQALAYEFSPNSRAIELPVIFGECFDFLKTEISKENHFPDQLWLFGLASNRREMCLERVALNWVETDFPDEKGQRILQPRSIDPLKPDAILLKEHPLIDKPRLHKNLKVSHSAGTYVCNDLYFRVLDYYQGYQNRIVFVHVLLENVSPIDEQVEILKSWIYEVSS